MEPILELSIRIVQYLWLIHDYFSDFHQFVCLPDDWHARLRREAEHDCSLLRNLIDLFYPAEATSSATALLKSGCALGDDDVADPVRRADRQPGMSVGTAADLAVGRFCGCYYRLKELLPGLEDLEKRTDDGPFTRESLVEEVAREILHNQAVIPALVEALAYEPQLFREVKVRNRGKLPHELQTNRAALMQYCRDKDMPVPFSFVLSSELDEIHHSREKRYSLLGAKIPERRTGLPAYQALESNLFGLALSGGGIRSATFALGVLQGLADRRMLPLVDYLSTVSGGGYIGSWLLAWTKRAGSIHAVQRSLQGAGTDVPCPSELAQSPKPKKGEPPAPAIRRNSDPRSEHVRPIRMLREYSRYLAPQAGLFSADSWTIWSTWVRNTFLNLLVLISFLAAALLVPRVAARVTFWARDWRTAESFWNVLVAAIPLWLACLFVGWNLRAFRCWRPGGSTQALRGDSEGVVVASILSLIVFGAFWELIAIWQLAGYTSQNALGTALASWVVFVVGIAIVSLYVITSRSRRVIRPKQAWIGFVLATVISPAVGAVLIYAACTLFFQNIAQDTQRGLWISITVGFCALLAIISTVVALFIGLFGVALGDEQREWWSRLGGWVSIVMAAWLVISGICFFSPLWIAKAGIKVAAAGISWAAITLSGVKLAFSEKSGRDPGTESQGRLRKAIMNLAPAVFVLGLLSVLAFGLNYVTGRLLNLPLLHGTLGDPVAHILCCTGGPFSFQRLADNYWASMYPGSNIYWYLLGALLSVSLLLAWRIDINQFSMHDFYKNRLVRAYLGASRSRAHRWPNAFTGFDFEDDIRLARFRVNDATQPEDAWTDCKSGYIGPYPIINTALNITRGQDLGQQERKAESFIFTPLWSGFDFTRKQTSVAEVAASEYAFRKTDYCSDPEHGIFTGTAMAISGAAFNTNMGFHTSPAIAFLLTVFNVRLGWWIGNPRKNFWRRPSPGLGLAYLVFELTAQTSTERGYVLLSDGGHFENMGLYELVRRRCKFIIVSDAEEDAKFKLEGIGGAIRKCRVDFGVVIDLDLDGLKPIGDPAQSTLHYSIGTILYPEAGPHDADAKHCGTLVYIKSSVTGDEPVDVIEFRKRQPAFPHNSTVNQFFDESHFESYRALGHHAAQGIFPDDARVMLERNGHEPARALKQIFCDIRKCWQEKLKDEKRRKASGEAVGANA